MAPSCKEAFNFQLLTFNQTPFRCRWHMDIYKVRPIYIQSGKICLPEPQCSLQPCNARFSFDATRVRTGQGIFNVPTRQLQLSSCIHAKILNFWHTQVSTTSTHLYVNFNANAFFHPRILLLLCGQHGVNTQPLLGEYNEPRIQRNVVHPLLPQTQAPHLHRHPLPSTSLWLFL